MSPQLNAPLRLLITSDAVGGVWTYTLDLADALGREGVDVTIAVLGPAPSPAQARDATTTGATLRILDAPLDWLADNEDDVALAARAIAALAAEMHADVIQVHSPALIAQADMPAPVVSVIHSCVASWWAAVRGGDMPADLRWRARLVAEGLQRASVSVAASRSFARDVARIYGGPTPLVVHNARKPVLPATAAAARFVLSAGRFWDESKDLATLDRAAPSCALPIIAAGPLASPFGSSVTASNLDARGSLDPVTLQGLLAQQPIFCSTAVYEPFGLAVLEAAQAGCALVLSAIPTFQELWDGAALFAPARDPKAFAAALNALAQDDEWRLALGASARARAAQFTLAQQARDMMQVYRAALAGTRAEAAA